MDFVTVVLKNSLEQQTGAEKLILGLWAEFGFAYCKKNKAPLLLVVNGHNDATENAVNNSRLWVSVIERLRDPVIYILRGSTPIHDGH